MAISYLPCTISTNTNNCKSKAVGNKNKCLPYMKEFSDKIDEIWSYGLSHLEHLNFNELISTQ
jgi:hypothetical protein